MKNIAIIIQYLYGGGAERAAGLLSKYLCGIYNVYLFLWDTQNIVYEYGGEIVDVGIAGPEYYEYYIGQYKKKYEIDCAISFLEPSNFFNIRTKGKERVIISERCTQSLFASPHYSEQFQIKALYNKADAIISVAEGVKYDLVHSFGIKSEKIKTIYNFINKKAIAEKSLLDEEVKIDSFVGSSKLIINIGRLEEQKNQKRLIMQFAKLVNSKEDVKLLIMGSGSLQKELQDLIEQLELNEHVKILSYCKNPFPYLKRASICVVASRYEGLPNVVLEAMCLNIPVVAVDCLSGPRELLSGKKTYEEKLDKVLLCERGILVTDAVSEDTGESSYLEEAMKFILDHKEFADKIKENQKYYMEQYSNENIKNKWIEVIEQVQNEYSDGEFYDRLEPDKKIVVYGAGYYGKKVIAQLRKEGMDIFSVAVSDMQNNPLQFCGIPVRDIDSLSVCNEEMQIVIGVLYKYQDEVVKKLLSLGFTNIHFLCLTPETAGVTEK